MANVTPFPKGPTIEDFNSDLRPISPTSTLSKISEACVIEQKIKSTLLKVIDPKQFGFVADSCTILSLISMLHNWLDATGEPGQARVYELHCWIIRAFDLVDHSVLINKLFYLGIKSSVVDWLNDF